VFEQDVIVTLPLFLVVQLVPAWATTGSMTASAIVIAISLIRPSRCRTGVVVEAAAIDTSTPPSMYRS